MSEFYGTLFAFPINKNFSVRGSYRDILQCRIVESPILVSQLFIPFKYGILFSTLVNWHQQLDSSPPYTTNDHFVVHWFISYGTSCLLRHLVPVRSCRQQHFLLVLSDSLSPSWGSPASLGSPDGETIQIMRLKLYEKYHCICSRKRIFGLNVHNDSLFNILALKVLFC